MENNEFDVIVEIPKGSRNKYEMDKESGRIRLDRMIFSSMRYPADYGYIENTWALDDDPLDALVFVSEPTFPGCVIRVRAIGVFHMTDDKGPDEKLLCVPVSDPNWNTLFRLDQMHPHLLNEVKHFFQVYKDLEEKKVDVGGYGDEKEALQILESCRQRFIQLKK